METRNEHFRCQGSGFSQIFQLIVSTSEKILNNINVVLKRQVKWVNSLLLVAIGDSETSHSY